jgi:hypothetical protein
MPPSYPAGSYPAAVVADGAVAYWRLGETSGTTAVDVIGGANGTISGGVTLGQAGALADGDKAMGFNNGSVIVPNGAYSAVGTGPFSWELWLRYTSTAASFAYLISCRSPAPQTGFDAYVTISGGLVTARVWQSTSAYTATSSLPTDPNGQWHHFVGVLTRGASDVMTLYRDGLSVGTVTLPAAGWNLTNTSSFVIGNSLENDTPWIGTLDDVAIYPTALTAPQIAAHYAAKDWTAAPSFGPAYQEMRYRWCRYVAGQVRR